MVIIKETSCVGLGLNWSACFINTQKVWVQLPTAADILEADCICCMPQKVC